MHPIKKTKTFFGINQPDIRMSQDSQASWSWTSGTPAWPCLTQTRNVPVLNTGLTITDNLGFPAFTWPSMTTCSSIQSRDPSELTSTFLDSYIMLHLHQELSSVSWGYPQSSSSRHPMHQFSLEITMTWGSLTEKKLPLSWPRSMSTGTIFFLRIWEVSTCAIPWWTT
jgi:hypothetical protein